MISKKDAQDTLQAIDFTLRQTGLQNAKRLLELADKFAAIRDAHDQIEKTADCNGSGACNGVCAEPPKAGGDDNHNGQGRKRGRPAKKPQGDELRVLASADGGQ
jgi:hypothetical protein